MSSQKLTLHRLALAVAVGFFAISPATAATVSGVADVVDGDTLAVGAARVRLHGIDAAEAGQQCERPDGRSWRCGEAATDLLIELTKGQTIECDIREVDVYGRMISVCTANGIDLGKAIVEDGLAWAFRQYSDDYVAQEDAAKRAQIGIWLDGANPTTPWEYRANKWERAADASPRSGCPIKGNISQKGERIYHTPWSPWYTRTKINTSKGEKWFCDEAEAINSGWRPARAR